MGGKKEQKRNRKLAFNSNILTLNRKLSMYYGLFWSFQVPQCSYAKLLIRTFSAGIQLSEHIIGSVDLSVFILVWKRYAEVLRWTKMPRFQNDGMARRKIWKMTRFIDRVVCIIIRYFTEDVIQHYRNCGCRRTAFLEYRQRKTEAKRYRDGWISIRVFILVEMMISYECEISFKNIYLHNWRLYSVHTNRNRREKRRYDVDSVFVVVVFVIVDEQRKKPAHNLSAFETVEMFFINRKRLFCFVLFYFYCFATSRDDSSFLTCVSFIE